jgi:hypothetical protein
LSSSLQKRRIFSQTFFVSERRFTLDVSTYTNGSFVLVYEDEPRIGSLVVSMKEENKPGITSSSLIPDARGGLLPRMVAEMAASIGQGIILSSTFFKHDLTEDQMKLFLRQLRENMKEGLRSSENT